MLPSSTMCYLYISWSKSNQLSAMLSRGREVGGCLWWLSRQLRLATTVSRSPDYAKVEQADVDHFRKILGPQGVVTDPDALKTFNKWVHHMQ